MGTIIREISAYFISVKMKRHKIQKENADEDLLFLFLNGTIKNIYI